MRAFISGPTSDKCIIVPNDVMRLDVMRINHGRRLLSSKHQSCVLYAI
jgi:hypothetical protein